MLTIDRQVARRYILGRQGLWPGRRWRGEQGTAQAMRDMEYLQLDPLQIIARSHDIQLHSRVLDYVPDMWEEVAYRRRGFFDWGGWLAARPMEELPYWRVVMRREREGHPDVDPRVRQTGQKHADAIEEMRDILRARKTVTNRDFKMSARKRTESYRGRKDSAVALYHLWRTGEVMTHHRENFERVYALAENVAPAHLLAEHDDVETDRFLLMKEIRFFGLSRLRRTADSRGRGVPHQSKEQLLAQLVTAGKIVEVEIEGWRGKHYAPGSDIDLLHELNAGRVPAAWTPLGSTTTEEALFLAPLDPVSARGRAKQVFEFDYVWEVYKPEQKRRFGYYALPVLWGDRLVARFDSKYDRTTRTFIVLGLWLEDDTLNKSEAFAAALGRGFGRFRTFLGAERIDAAAVEEELLRRHIEGREQA